MIYFIRRIFGIIPVLLVTWTLVFIVLEFIPGDPVNLMLAGRPASEEVRQREQERLGLDKPVLVRYGSFLVRAVQGDLGESFRTRQPVTVMIMEQLRPTLELSAGGFLVGVTLGIFLGVVAGVRPNSWLDTSAMFVALLGVSLPSFWTGMTLIFVFGTTLRWVPIVGDGITALILPSITVGLFLSGGLARLIRSSILEVMSQDYIRTARAKGLSHWVVVMKHAMRNALIPPVTLLGVQFGLLITGAVITESVFARPGLGQLLLQSVLAKDIPLVQALVVYATAVYIILNLMVDLLYGVIDPRIKLEQGS